MASAQLIFIAALHEPLSFQLDDTQPTASPHWCVVAGRGVLGTSHLHSADCSVTEWVHEYGADVICLSRLRNVPIGLSWYNHTPQSVSKGAHVQVGCRGLRCHMPRGLHRYNCWCVEGDVGICDPLCASVCAP